MGSELILTSGSISGDQRSNFSKPVSKRPRRSISKSKTSSPRNGSALSANFPIIVHCHLCWDWVWQRPQQFLSRLSARHKILFVETIGPDPQLSSAVARYWTAPSFPNVTILRLQFPLWRWQDGAWVDSERRRLVKEFLSGPGQLDKAVQWFYDPMAVPAFLGHMDEIATVYDCMDELSNFREAHPLIKTRERELLRESDVVFTGGRRLWESKRLHNGNCHFYGCGVDVAHFGKARGENTKIPDDIAALAKPVLGYFGVVDERMDYDLLVKLAEANPDWSIAMVGPRIKVDKVPQRPNIHWLGQKAYADLPSYCKAFDVCMMPFALNEATEFINPTKALEYMATGKPIVSSAIADVVTNFGSVVKIARSHDEFISLCRQAIEQRDHKAIEGGLKQSSENSWDSIVARLENHVLKALQQKHAAGVIA